VDEWLDMRGERMDSQHDKKKESKVEKKEYEVSL
jgi:hypothetical protein